MSEQVLIKFLSSKKKCKNSKPAGLTPLQLYGTSKLKYQLNCPYMWYIKMLIKLNGHKPGLVAGYTCTLTRITPRSSSIQANQRLRANFHPENTHGHYRALSDADCREIVQAATKYQPNLNNLRPPSF